MGLPAGVEVDYCCFVIDYQRIRLNGVRFGRLGEIFFGKSLRNSLKCCTFAA